MTGRLITDHSSPEQDASGATDLLAVAEPDLPEPPKVPQQDLFGGVSGLGAFAAIAAAALCFAFSPKVNSVTFTPKFAIVLLFAAVGIVPLARLVMVRSPLRWPARAAVAFLAVALVSALVSPSPNIGLFGLYLWGTGFLFWLGAAGAFAIGTCLGPRERRWLAGGLLVGSVGSALVAIFQIVQNSPTPGLSLYDGSQADAFLGNPIYLEALLLGGLALVLGKACRSPLCWGAVVLVLAVGLEFTFERFALAILALLVLYALYTYGTRGGGAFALLIAVGYGIAYLGGGSGLGSRVTSGTSETTFGLRLRVWLESARYVLHNPLLGAGPGQLRTAMDTSASLSFFQRVLVGRLLTDGHDIFVEVAVTTGLVGLVCFLVWLVGAARIAGRSALLGFSAAMIATELVEPINVAVLPLAFLALGAATAVRSRPSEVPGVATRSPGDLGSASHERARGIGGVPVARITTILAVAVALFLGVTMVTGDAYMFRSTSFAPGQPYNLAAANDSNRLLPYWPDSALKIAQIEAFDSLSGASAKIHLIEARRWTGIAASRDSDNPQLWTMLAVADVDLKAYGLARIEYYRALSCDKWFTQALQGLGQLAGIEHNWNEAVHFYRLALTTAEHDEGLAAPLRVLLSGAQENARSAGN
ncbi:MAG: O-antigen ligase family protein [Acidimicrobiales bacterium]